MYALKAVPQIIPDRTLVLTAQRVVTGANIHVVQKALKWYEHWCSVGNKAAAEQSAKHLRSEIVKALSCQEDKGRNFR